MREILAAELDAVLARRGLRARSWAVEFDDSAVEFLLTQGFTPDLGARPLKRAVERHFLTPLALAIAGHDVPEGDQFLFVRAGSDGLKVTFEDPDAPEIEVAPAPPETTLRTLAREGGAGVELLEEALADVSRAARSRRQGRAAGADGRAGLLGGRGARRGAERDRAARPHGGRPALRPVAARTASATPAARRPRSSAAPPSGCSCSTPRSTALAAGEPADARLRVDGDPVFGPRIVAMYQAWAHERGMRLRGRATSAAGGASAGARRSPASPRCRRCAPESGFHVLEIPDGRGGYDRRRVRVTVGEDARGRRSSAATASARRRWSATPSAAGAPGGLDAVLAGGFDLIE